MFKRIIEWDKKRKFGHTFEDFILILFTYVAVNMLLFFVSKELNLYVMVITALISVLLCNRSAP